VLWTYTNVKDFLKDIKNEKDKRVMVRIEEVEHAPDIVGFYIIATTRIKNEPARLVKRIEYANPYKEEEFEEIKKKVLTVFEQFKEDLKKHGIEVREGVAEFE